MFIDGARPALGRLVALGRMHEHVIFESGAVVVVDAVEVVGEGPQEISPRRIAL